MSKAALSLLARELDKKGVENTWQGTSNLLRKNVLDYTKHHILNSTIDEIENALRMQIANFDKKNNSDHYSTIDKAGAFTPAAKKFLEVFENSFTSVERDAAKGIPNVIAVVKSYDTTSKYRLKPAEAAAKKVIAELVGKDILENNRLLSPDHTLPNADIRFGRALYNVVSKTNPQLDNAEQIQNAGKSLIEELATIPYNGSPLISKATKDYFIDAYVEVSSRYTKGLTQKEFDLQIGVDVKPRSQLDNEDHGQQIKAYMLELAKAAKAIAGKQNWAATESSDDYITAVMKQLNNSAVKAGATGKLLSIDSKSNSVRVNRKLKLTEKIAKVKLGSKVKVVRSSTPKAKQSILSLNSIVGYINARLPDAVRRNMGPGSLVNRSGRFADSAQLVSASHTPQGYPLLAYTYQRSPYDVFDPVLGAKPWNTPGRDPKKLIDKSVRDIAREMAIGRFYVRRA